MFTSAGDWVRMFLVLQPQGRVFHVIIQKKKKEEIAMCVSLYMGILS